MKLSWVLGFAQIKGVSSRTTVVGLGITEHMPWDAINLKNFLAQLPILTKV